LNACVFFISFITLFD